MVKNIYFTMLLLAWPLFLILQTWVYLSGESAGVILYLLIYLVLLGISLITFSQIKATELRIFRNIIVLYAVITFPTYSPEYICDCRGGDELMRASLHSEKVYSLLFSSYLFLAGPEVYCDHLATNLHCGYSENIIDRVGYYRFIKYQAVSIAVSIIGGFAIIYFMRNMEKKR